MVETPQFPPLRMAAVLCRRLGCAVEDIFFILQAADAVSSAVPVGIFSESTLPRVRFGAGGVLPFSR